MFPVIAAIPCMLGVATKYCQILYFATCFCFVLALLRLALSFSFLIALLNKFSSGVSNALKALDRALLASERSERDTLRGNSIEISLYLFIYLFMGYVRPLFSPALLIT